MKTSVLVRVSKEIRWTFIGVKHVLNKYCRKKMKHILSSVYGIREPHDSDMFKENRIFYP
jgi:DUF438 domain-containing protein